MIELAPGGGLERAIPHYEDRAEQRVMAAAVARALDEARPLVVEAGTGTGKTLAYLIPALRSGKRVVVSTGTRALQDQIARHDIPLLRTILARPFTAVVLKGVSNYACRRKLGEAASRGGDGTLAALVDWAEHSETGDRAEVEWLAESAPLWSEITTTPDARIGSRCPYFERCFVTQARRLADKAELILVNHHLYLADRMLRAHAGARVLPDHDAVIFDEAHQLEDVATEHFGARISTHRLAELVRDAQLAMPHMPLWARAADDAIRTVERAGLALFALVRTALVAVESHGSAGARSNAKRCGGSIESPGSAGARSNAKRCGGSIESSGSAGASSTGDRGDRVPLPDGLFDHDDRRAAWFRLDTSLEELARVVESESEPAPDGEDDVAGPRATLPGVARRARELRDDLATIAEQRQRSHVYWGEVRPTGVFLMASPIDVANLMRRHVLAGPTPIFTSATLATASTTPAERVDAPPDFSYTRTRLGLDDADELHVRSPFDYARQALLYLPRDLPPPGRAFAGNELAPEAVLRTLELLEITGGRAFLLFTSHRALHAAAHQLAAMPYPRLVQGDGPRATLIDRFRATAGAVLLGTASFWEGVDVPGDALSLVVIDKLPFQPHTDPLVAARMQASAEAGRDPFTAIQLPQAALALKQGFGRLIRRRDDRGIVAILDPRIVTRTYGRVFVDSLPAGLPRTSALEQVRRWWRADKLSS